MMTDPEHPVNRQKSRPSVVDTPQRRGYRPDRQPRHRRRKEPARWPPPSSRALVCTGSLRGP